MRLGFFILILLSITLTGNCFAEGVVYPDSPRDVVIQMKTTSGGDSPLAGLIAIPELTLYGDGRVIYVKTDENRNRSIWEARVEPKFIGLLLDFIDKQGFYDLNENYLNLTIKDLDTTEITVRTNSGTKTIKVYGIVLASGQGMIPRGLQNIYRRLSNFSREDEKEYAPSKISLFVYEYQGNLPPKAKVEKWRVGKMDLREYVVKEKSLLIQYKETVLEGDLKNDVLKHLKGKTLYENAEGFAETFFVHKKVVFKVAYRPHLPYEQ
jgi:hypothetical protein